MHILLARIKCFSKKLNNLSCECDGHKLLRIFFDLKSVRPIIRLFVNKIPKHETGVRYWHALPFYSFFYDFFFPFSVFFSNPSITRRFNVLEQTKSIWCCYFLDSLFYFLFIFPFSPLHHPICLCIITRLKEKM